MIELYLDRFCYSKMGTFGKLPCDVSTDPEDYFDKFFYTVEQPWQNNELFKSCIPEGRYICKRFSSVKHPDTFEVTGVPGRTAILFHIGNTKDDFQGCIGLGLDLGVVNSKWAVTGSTLAMAKFREMMKGVEEFKLVVQGVGFKKTFENDEKGKG